MAKTIAVSDEVYKKLKKARVPGESFSLTIKRTLEARPKLSSIAGSAILSKEDWKSAKNAISKAEKKTLEQLSRNA